MRTDVTPLALGGVPAHALAQAYGTPLLAIDTDVLDRNLAHFAALGAELALDVAYAGKALLVVALARRLVATPLCLDVCSLGELLTAEAAAFPAARLVFHGCGKTPEELRAAADGRVGRVVVDHHDELAALAALASPARPIRVLLRVNAGIAADTHAAVRTGGDDSKFGFALDELDAAVASALAAPGLRLIGLHHHAGSQIFDAGPYLASVPILVERYARAVRAGGRLEELVLGGGFGVAADGNAARFDVAGLLRDATARVRALARSAGIDPPRIGIEPGRAIVADAGTSLYRVVTVKRQGRRRYAIVDGSIADNPRPALYGAVHAPALAGRVSLAPAVPTVVCGRSCENDWLADAALPLDLSAGDLLALSTTGAYTYSMASNYNRFGRPAVVFAGGGAHALVARSESSADVLRNDVEPQW